MKKWWDKDLQLYVDNNKLLNERQYVRKTITTIENLVSRPIIFSYKLVKGEEIIHIDYYVKNCYERIVPEVALLASISMGMHPKNYQLIVKVLNHFRHHLIIRDSKSKKNYRNSPLFLILCIEQGMGWPPTLLSLVNDITITLMETNIPGEVFTSPLSAWEVVTSLEAYFGDVNGVFNSEEVRAYNEKYKTKYTIKKAILTHIYTYERYIRCSGGVWSRASGYTLKLIPHRNLFFNADTNPLQVIDPYNNKPKLVPMKSANEATKTLVVWISPKNKNKKQFYFLQRKIKTWIDNIGNSHLPSSQTS